MKRVLTLFLLLAMFTLMLTSCMRIEKQVTIEEISGTLVVSEINRGYEITFNGVSYIPVDKDGYYFYRQSGESVAHYWGTFGFSSVNVLPHKDLGIMFTICHPIFGEVVSTSCPYLNENAIIPELESIIISDIVYVIDDIFTNNYIYYELNNHEDLKSRTMSTVFDAFHSKTDGIIMLGDIINFNEMLLLNEECIEYENDFVFIPEHYTSFICGPFDLIELDNEFYMMLDKQDAKTIYKIQDEYQELFFELIDEITK